MFGRRERPALQALREPLLRGGIAPAQVERYLSELSDHLEDLSTNDAKNTKDTKGAKSC